MSLPQFTAVGLGGTFDHFHKGHEFFISYAASLGQKLVIGVATDSLLKTKKYSHSLENWQTRSAAVQNYCQKNNITVEIIELNDIYGPTLTETEVQAICVTSETLGGAKKINIKRKELNLEPLPIMSCELLTDDSGQEIHSERIRAGEINRQGLCYESAFRATLTLTPFQRDYFSKPQGELLDLQSIPVSTPVVSVVGDNSLEHFLAHNWPVTLGVYDSKRQREVFSSTVIDNLKPGAVIDNPPGTITPALVEILKQLLHHPTQNPEFLKINGEEDLATVALMLLQPLGTLIFYGQPNQGIVKVEVTEELKDQVYSVLSTLS